MSRLRKQPVFHAASNCGNLGHLHRKAAFDSIDEFAGPRLVQRHHVD